MVNARNQLSQHFPSDIQIDAVESHEMPAEHATDLNRITPSDLADQLNHRAQIKMAPAWVLFASAAALAGVALACFLFNVQAHGTFPLRPAAKAQAGPILVLNLYRWKPWCGECRRQISAFLDVERTFKSDADVAFRMQASDRPAILVMGHGGDLLARLSGADLQSITAIDRSIVSAKLGKATLAPIPAGVRNGFILPPFVPASMSMLSLSALISGLVVGKRLKNKRQTCLIYHLDPLSVAKFTGIQASFQKLAEASRVWKIVSTTSTRDWKRNAGCNFLVQRTPVKCGSIEIPNVSANMRVSGIDAGDVRLVPLPDMMLYWQSGRFAAVNYRDMTLSYSESRFTEDEQPPSDASIVENTWRYINKDGSPDKRFSQNYTLPVVVYGDIKFAFKTGVTLYLQVSSVKAASGFVENFKSALSHRRPFGGESRAPRPTAITPDAAWAAKILELELTASQEQISAAYKRLAQMSHPDKVVGLAPEFQQLADRKMKELNQAYSMLRKLPRAAVAG